MDPAGAYVSIVFESTTIESLPTAGSVDAGPVVVDRQAVAVLAVIADPSRYALVQALTAGTTCVCALQTQVPIAANLLSYHLKVLREAGLITAARRGRWIDYTLAPDALDRLRGALPGAPAERGYHS